MGDALETETKTLLIWQEEHTPSIMKLSPVSKKLYITDIDIDTNRKIFKI